MNTILRRRGSHFAGTSWLLLLLFPLLVGVGHFNWGVNDCDGFVGPYYDRQWIIPGQITNETWYTPAPRLISGRAAYYAPGVMERMVRHEGVNLDGFVGAVAMPSPGDWGEVIWLRRQHVGVWEGPFLVIDYSYRCHAYANIAEIGLVVEVGWETAKAWGLGQGAPNIVDLFKGIHPPDVMGFDAKPQSYSSWFLYMVEFAGTYEKVPLFRRNKFIDGDCLIKKDGETIRCDEIVCDVFSWGGIWGCSISDCPNAPQKVDCTLWRNIGSTLLK